MKIIKQILGIVLLLSICAYGKGIPVGRIRVPTSVVNESEAYVNDSYTMNGIEYNQTQGIASDGVRYLYWVLRDREADDHATAETYDPDNHGDLIRKWDTWNNESAGLSTDVSVKYGHCEDIAFIPSYFSGFDDGNVDRLYLIDLKRTKSDELLIHVVNADTLEYINSFSTAELGPSSTEHWNGACHVWCSQEHKKIVLESVTPKEENSSRRHIVVAIYSMDGTLEKAVEFDRTTGTEFGMDCDKDYIYLSRYVSGEEKDRYKISLFALNWDLQPVARVDVEQFAWEIEGVCHIGEDYYISYIGDRKEKGAVIVKAHLVYEEHNTRELPLSWTGRAGYPLDSFVYLKP